MLNLHLGKILQKMGEKKFRPATHLKQGKIAQSLTHGPSEFFVYEKLVSTPTEEILAGNMSSCLNRNVLKVISSEVRKKTEVPQ